MPPKYRLGCLTLAALALAAIAVWQLLEGQSVPVSAWVFVGGVAALWVSALVYVVVESVRPCRHGRWRAHARPSPCSLCEREAAQQQAEAERQAAVRIAEEQVRRQKEYDEYRTRIRLPSYLEQMDPREFELLVCDLYTRQGYRVQVTPYSGDSGVDGYLRRDDKLYLLQCKRTKGSVGQPVLRDLFGTMTHEGAAGGIVVTTGKVSRQARKWAVGKPITFVESIELCAMIRRLYAEGEIVPDSWQSSSRRSRR